MTSKTRRTLAILEALAPTPGQLMSAELWARYCLGIKLLESAKKEQPKTCR